METEYNYYMIMDNCEKNLKEFIDKLKNGLNVDVKREIFITLNITIATIRSINIIHRDIKPQNN